MSDDVTAYQQRQQAYWRQFWLALLITVVLNGIVLNTVSCYYLTGRAFNFWILLVIAELVITVKGFALDAKPIARGVAFGCGVCLLLIPLFGELCLAVSGTDQ